MKRIVITGGSRGLGKAIAQRFQEAGWSVFINGRNEKTLQQTIVEIGCRGLAGDVTDETHLQALWNMAAAEGPVDVWINNAGLDHPRAMVWNLDARDIRTVLDVNIFGSIAGTRVAIRGMKSQADTPHPHPGIIYLMEGMGSDGMVRPRISIYGTSKAAVRYLYRALRAELKGENGQVRIGVISPGIVVTDLLKGGLPEDVAEAAQAKRIFNILADTPDTVSAFIARRIISTAPEKVTWLTGTKIAWRFASASFRHRKLFP